MSTEVDELLAQIERLKIRGAAYEAAYGIAYQATRQSHAGHWDATGRHGGGCPECIRAREARENCEAVLHEGLAKLLERSTLPNTATAASGEQPEAVKQDVRGRAQRLANELSDLHIAAIRQGLGNTNANVLELRISELRAALAGGAT